MELPSIWGAEGTGGSYPRVRVREAGPPVHRYLDAIRHTDLTMGTVYTISRYTMTTRPRAEQREEAAREDLLDLCHRRAQGRLRGARGAFFPAVSPLTWRTSALRIAA